MDTLKVSTLIEALQLVGQVYRSEDGSTAEAVREVLRQFEGASDLTLAEWAAAKELEKSIVAPTQWEPHAEPADHLDDVMARLEQIGSQAALSDAIGSLSLSAPGWRALAKKLTGDAGQSAEAACRAVYTHLSDRLLLEERIEAVKRQFG
jgi:hypothetical protein